MPPEASNNEKATPASSGRTRTVMFSLFIPVPRFTRFSLGTPCTRVHPMPFLKFNHDIDGKDNPPSEPYRVNRLAAVPQPRQNRQLPRNMTDFANGRTVARRH